MESRSGNAPSSESLHPLDSLRRTRAVTLRLVSGLTDEELAARPFEEARPIAWHLGHIALVQLREAAPMRLGGTSDEMLRLFESRPVALPADHRWPAGRLLLELLAQALRAVESDSAPAELLRPLAAHEQGHAEEIVALLRARGAGRRPQKGWPLPEETAALPRPPLVLPGGVHHGRIERPVTLDGTCATNLDWLEFIVEGGYQRRELWSEVGWRACREASWLTPSTWLRGPRGFLLRTLGGDVRLPPGHPVEGVSCFEAEAYARFRGGRLPTVREWQRAALVHGEPSPCLGLVCGGARPAGSGGHDLVGNVWEWTASDDRREPLLCGGSWASQGAMRLIRPAPPRSRVGAFGVRVARDL